MFTFHHWCLVKKYLFSGYLILIRSSKSSYPLARLSSALKSLCCRLQWYPDGKDEVVRVNDKQILLFLSQIRLPRVQIFPC